MFCSIDCANNLNMNTFCKQLHLFEWRNILCKHDSRWLHIFRLKASAFYHSFLKTYRVNKTHRLKLGKRCWHLMYDALDSKIGRGNNP